MPDELYASQKRVGMTGVKPWLHVDEVVTHLPEIRLLRVRGELDLRTIAELRDTVTPRVEPGYGVILDLAELAFCDSTGLGAIIRLHRQAIESKARFALCAPTPRVAEVLSISGVDQVVTVHPTQVAAVNALRLPT